jgi:hypothetical protein
MKANLELIEKLNAAVKQVKLTKGSRVYKELKWRMQNMQTGDKFIIRPITTEGNGYHRHYVDRTKEYQKIFDIMGLTYTLTNDAPKGGKEGWRFDVKL